MLLKFLFVLFERQSYKFLPDLFIQMYKAKRKKDFVDMTHSPSLQILGPLFTKENGNLGTSELRTMITVYWSFLCLHSEKPLHGIHRGLWFCLGSFPKVSPYTSCNRLYLEIKGNEVCIQKVCVHATSLSRLRLFATLWTVACQAPLSVGFSRQEYWSGLPCPPPGDLPDTGIEPSSLRSPALAGGFFITSTSWKAHRRGHTIFIEVKVSDLKSTLEATESTSPGGLLEMQVRSGSTGDQPKQYPHLIRTP